jgi:hypothetical protein
VGLTCSTVVLDQSRTAVVVQGILAVVVVQGILVVGTVTAAEAGVELRFGERERDMIASTVMRATEGGNVTLTRVYVIAMTLDHAYSTASMKDPSPPD